MPAWYLQYLVVMRKGFLVAYSPKLSIPLCPTNHLFCQSTQGLGLTRKGYWSPDQCSSRCLQRETLNLSLKQSSGICSWLSSVLCIRSTRCSRSAQSIDRLIEKQHPGCAPTSLHHLWAYHPQQWMAREMEICNMHFHLALTVDAISNAIDDLMELAEYALMPMPSTH